MTTFRMFEYLNNRIYRPSTKQFLNNFWECFLEKLKQFLGRESKMGCLFIKKRNVQLFQKLEFTIQIIPKHLLSKFLYNYQI